MLASMTAQQKHWLLYVARHDPGVCMKVPRVTAVALVRLGYAVERSIPLVERKGLVLTPAGRRYAKTGDQAHLRKAGQ